MIVSDLLYKKIVMIRILLFLFNTLATFERTVTGTYLLPLVKAQILIQFQGGFLPFIVALRTPEFFSKDTFSASPCVALAGVMA